MGGGQESQKRGYPGGVLKDGRKSAIVCFFICEHVICSYVHMCVSLSATARLMGVASPLRLVWDRGLQLSCQAWQHVPRPIEPSPRGRQGCRASPVSSSSSHTWWPVGPGRYRASEWCSWIEPRHTGWSGGHGDSGEGVLAEKVVFLGLGVRLYGRVVSCLILGVPWIREASWDSRGTASAVLT